MDATATPQPGDTVSHSRSCRVSDARYSLHMKPEAASTPPPRAAPTGLGGPSGVAARRYSTHRAHASTFELAPRSSAGASVTGRIPTCSCNLGAPGPQSRQNHLSRYTVHRIVGLAIAAQLVAWGETTMSSDKNAPSCIRRRRPSGVGVAWLTARNPRIAIGCTYL